MNRRKLVLGSTAMLGLLLAGCSLPGGATAQLIVLRHADRDGDSPELNATGLARAANLPEALADLPVDAIFLPDLERNRTTAAPLAAARGLPLRTLDVLPGLGARLRRESYGRSVVWIGNSNNIHQIWQELDLPGDPPVDYGAIAVVSGLQAAAPRVRQLRFDP